MSEEERLRAAQAGLVNSPYDGPEGATFHATRFLHHVQPGMRARSGPAPWEISWRQEVARGLKNIPVPKREDYPGDTTAFCRAIEEHFAQRLELHIHAERLHHEPGRLDMVNLNAQIFQKAIDKIRAPFPPLKANASQDERIHYEIEKRSRDIPQLHLLCPGDWFGGNAKQRDIDEAAYKKSVAEIRVAVYGEFGLQPPEVIRAAKEAKTRRLKIWLMAGAAATTLLVGAGVMRARSEPARPGAPAMATSEALQFKR